MDVLYGLHAVEEVLRAGSRSFDHVAVARDRKDAKLERLVALCREKGVRLRFEPREELTRLAGNDTHQGAVAVVKPKAMLDLEDLIGGGAAGVAERPHPLLLLALDGVEDPHNFGALLRSAEGAGADGVIVRERRSAPLNATVAKASAGASEYIRVAQVTNLTRALERLKQANVWCVGLDERGERTYDDFDYRGDCALVLGREGGGLHDLVRKHCDHLVRIPMAGKIGSLNVSVAGAVVLYEAARQRRMAADAFRAKENATAIQPKRPLKGLGS